MRAESRRAGLAVIACALLALGGCTEMENAMAAVDFLNFMRDAPSFDPYEAPRPAPPNAVPVESPAERWEPTLEKPVTETALRAFGDTMTNPFAASEPVLARGLDAYVTYCAVCHGPEGRGDGPIIGPGKFPLAPDLTAPTTVARSDGYLYAIIKAGRGLMPSYQRIPPSDRWAVVTYLRALQQGTVGAAAPAGAQPAGAATDSAAAPQAQEQD